MTEADSPAPQSGLIRINQTLKDLTSLVTTIGTLVAALYAIYTSYSAHEISVNAKKTASNTAATVAAQANAALAAQPGAADQPGTAGSAAPVPYTLQLATYQTQDCAAAEQEIAGYGSAFSPPATLWRDPAGQYVIIGIRADDLGTAQKLQRTARALSQQPSQAGNDLANAIVRKAPPWTPLKTCSAL